MKLSAIATIVLLMSLHAYAGELSTEETKNLKTMLQMETPGSYSVVVSENIVALHRKGGGTRFFYDDDIPLLKRLAQEVGIKPIVVSNATASDILAKAGLKAASVTANPSSVRRRQEPDNSIEAEKALRSFDRTKTLGNEATCMNAFDIRSSEEDVWFFAGSHSGERGFYLMTPSGLHFYPTKDGGPFKNCMEKTKEYHHFYTQVKLTGVKPYYLTVSEPTDRAQATSVTHGSRPPKEMAVCDISNHEVLDAEAKEQLNAELAKRVATVYEDYQKDLQLKIDAARAGAIIPAPNPKNSENILAACAKVKSSVVQKAVDDARAKFVAAAPISGPKSTTKKRKAIR